MLGQLIDTTNEVRRRTGSYARSRRRLRSIQKANPAAANHELPKEVRSGIDRLWKDPFRRSLAREWCRVYAVSSGIDDHRYVPGYMFTHDIAGRLNAERLAPAYTDKNLYDRWFPSAPMPETVVRNIHGRFYDAWYDPLDESEAALAPHAGQDLVVKPTIESGGGSNVYVGRFDGKRFETAEGSRTPRELFGRYGSNFIVQRRLEQHRTFASLHPDSLNTLRILTLRYEDQIRVISTVLRMGNRGSRVDNQTSGGMSCGVGVGGDLNPFGLDVAGLRYESHPHTRTRFDTVRLPGLEEVHALVTRLHGDLHHFDVVSWDAAVGPDGEAVLVEFNLLAQGIVLHQLNNGPLFGDATDAVLRYAAARRP